MAYSDLAVMAATIGSLLFGYQLAAMNTVMVFFTLGFEVCGDSYTYTCDAARQLEPYCGTAVFVGAMVGCFGASPIAAKGRRLLLYVTHATSIIGAAICFFSVNFMMLICGRLVCGLCVGFICVSSPTLISEMSPAKVRGARGVLHQLMITVGILVAVALGLLMQRPPEVADSSYEVPAFEKNFARVMLALPGFVSLIEIFIFLFVVTDETPQGLAARKDLNGALVVLNKIYPDTPEDAEEALAAIMESDDNKGEEGAEKPGLMASLSKPGYLTAVLVGSFLSMGQQLSGINAFVAQSNKIFAESGMTAEMCVRMSTIMGVVNVLLTVPAAIVVDRFGRKPLLVIGCFGQGLSLSIVPLFYFLGKSTLVASAVAIVSYVVFFALAYGPVLWVYLFEMYPNDIKGPAASFASGLNWVVGCAVVFINNKFGHYMVANFTTFAALSWVSLIFIILFIKETKGTTRSPYAIQVDDEKAALIA